MVSFAESVTTAYNLKTVSYDSILNDIRSGSFKNKIETLRTIKEKSLRQEFKKKNLPYICPTIFKNGRRKAESVDYTQFMMFDIDTFETSKITLLEMKQLLRKDEQVYSFFVSPSGNGLKILYNLDEKITDWNYYKQVYEHYGRELTAKYEIVFDPSCKDISRTCYLSYDPEPFINQKAIPLNSTIDLSILSKPSSNGHYIPKGDTENEPDVLFEGIKNYLEKKRGLHYIDGYKHSFLVAFSGISNTYGVNPEYLIPKFIQEYQNKTDCEFVKDGDFEKIVNDVYRTYSSQHATKKYVVGKLNESLSKGVIVYYFWYKEKDKLTISREHLLKFLEVNGFAKLYFSKSIMFIRVIDNIIFEYDTNRIKDFVLHSSKGIDEPGLYELLLRGVNVYFAENFLSSIETLDPKLKRDTATESFFYFYNCFAKVTLDKISFHNYSELDALIWDSQKMKRDFVPNDVESDFEKFITNIGRNDLERVNSLKSSIGYLLHSYKDSSNAKAIIFCDERIGDGSNGRCGKSLVGKAIGKMKNLVEENGRGFSFKSNFAFQKISLDTQIYFFNDTGKTFDFNKLFSMITDSMTVEKKNKDAFTIGFQESPKIVLSTNYVIKENDDSTADRKFEIEFSDYYNIHHKPLDDFGKKFFDDWNDLEWCSFYFFMISCVQLYLNNGLIKAKYVNLEAKKFEAITGKDFLEFINEIALNSEHNKRNLYEDFRQLYPDYYDLRQNTFSKWIKEFAKFKGYNFYERKSGNDFLIMLST